MQIDALVPLLEVADVERSRQFYGRLGFEAQSTRERGGTTTWAMLRNGGQALILRCGAGGPPAGMLCLFVASAHAAQAALREAGLQPTAVERRDDGMDACYLRDPDGHTIAVASPVLQLA